MTIQTMALNLLRNVPIIRQHPDAADILATISHAVRDAQRTIDRPPPRVYAGPCPACGFDLLGHPGLATVTCHQCGQAYVVGERQQAMREALEDHLGNASYAATACSAVGLRVNPDTIRKWVERGLLARHGGLLRIGDVIDLALEQRARLAQRGR